MITERILECITLIVKDILATTSLGGADQIAVHVVDALTGRGVVYAGRNIFAGPVLAFTLESVTMHAAVSAHLPFPTTCQPVLGRVGHSGLSREEGSEEGHKEEKELLHFGLRNRGGGSADFYSNKLG